MTDTQFTPVHTRLWHREFWMLTFAGMLLTVSAFMQLPVLGKAQIAEEWSVCMGWGYALFGVGLLSLGCLISFLVEKYRRNAVCIWAILAYMALFAAICYVDHLVHDLVVPAFLALRFMEGAAYGLAQMVLVSTLVTDCCESAQRTDANYAMAWFQRMAVAIGPAAGMVVVKFYGGDYPLMAVLASALLALVLVLFVDFPFRAPEDTSFHLSLDRFFMPESMRIAAHVFAVGLVMGLMVVACFSLSFFALLIVGFLLALGGEIILGKNSLGDLEPVVGMALLILALGMELLGIPFFSNYMVPMLAGCGVGLSMARMQIFFILISAHCQRGTSQSSFWSVWELGVALGISLSFAFMANDPQPETMARRCVLLAVCITVASLIGFVLYTRKWYQPHIRR